MILGQRTEFIDINKLELHMTQKIDRKVYETAYPINKGLVLDIQEARDICNMALDRTISKLIDTDNVPCWDD